MEQLFKGAKDTFEQLGEGIGKAGKDIKRSLENPTFRRFVQEQLGYPLEKHTYSTSDGYINTVFRIPGMKGETPEQARTKMPKPVVIYQHGLTDSCTGIVCAEEQSLGIKLVNAGYDLWLPNSRGNRYSRDHQWIDVDTCKDDKKAEYWKFSFQDLGEYDQPALWEYILRNTGVEQISYIGHSQGTCQMFVAMCEHTEFFRRHMKQFIALAPILKINNMTSPFVNSNKENDKSVNTARMLGPELMASATSDDPLKNALTNSFLGESISHMVTKDFSDADPSLIDKSGFINFGKFYPAGCSF